MFSLLASFDFASNSERYYYVAIFDALLFDVVVECRHILKNKRSFSEKFLKHSFVSLNPFDAIFYFFYGVPLLFFSFWYSTISFVFIVVEA